MDSTGGSESVLEVPQEVHPGYDPVDGAEGSGSDGYCHEDSKSEVVSTPSTLRTGTSDSSFFSSPAEEFTPSRIGRRSNSAHALSLKARMPSDKTFSPPPQLVGTPFDIGPIRFEYPFHEDNSGSEISLSSSVPFISTSLDFSYIRTTSNPFALKAIPNHTQSSPSPPHPKFRSLTDREPPVPPGLAKKQHRLSADFHVQYSNDKLQWNDLVPDDFPRGRRGFHTHATISRPEIQRPVVEVLPENREMAMQKEGGTFTELAQSVSDPQCVTDEVGLKVSQIDVGQADCGSGSPCGGNSIDWNAREISPNLPQESLRITESAVVDQGEVAASASKPCDAINDHEMHLVTIVSDSVMNNMTIDSQQVAECYGVVVDKCPKSSSAKDEEVSSVNDSGNHDESVVPSDAKMISKLRIPSSGKIFRVFGWGI